MEFQVIVTIIPMTRDQRARWPGWRNIRADGVRRAGSVNLDVVSPQCVGWRYVCDGEEPAVALGAVPDVAEQQEGDLQQVDGGISPPDSLTSGSVSPPLLGADGGLAPPSADVSMDWDDYGSDPSFVTGVSASSHPNVLDTAAQSFDVDDLALSTDTGSDVFELQRNQLPPPPLPPRAERTTSVIICSKDTCKRRRRKSQ